jgi:hypothetical protein
MKAWEIFINESENKRNLLAIYTELREEFQRLKFKEEDLVSPPIYSNRMWQLKSLFENNLTILIKQINSYGFEVSNEEIHNYLSPLLQEINKKTPL